MANENDEAALLAEMADAPSFTKGPSTEQSLKLTAMANELADVDQKIEDLEEQLEAAKARKLKITMEEMPEFMHQISQDRIGLPDRDMDLVLEPYYHANIKAEWPEEQREAAFAWLEESQNGDMIKLEITLLFPRTCFALAQWVMNKIKALKPPKDLNGSIPDFSVSKTVPWNTLTAFVKREIEAGRKLPLDVLGATVGEVVKIKPRNKSPKRKK